MNNLNVWEQKYYLSIRRVRDLFSMPLARILNKTGLTPNMLTGLGFCSFIVFFVLIVLQNKYALLFIIIGLSLDMFDGALARVQNKSSDRGKFVDVLFDAINFAIFVFALIYIQFLSGFVGAVFIFLISLSKVLRMIYHARFLQTDWFFKSTAGFTPIFLIGLSYLFFYVHYFYGVLPMDYIFLIFSAILIFDIVYFYRKLYYEQ